MTSLEAGKNYEFFLTIAPFLLFRAYEQIKLNVASRNLDVNLIANGGGYGYGIMGPSHHALNDLGLISGLENIQGYVPACELDVFRSVLESLNTGLKYFRLGLNPNKIEKTFLISLVVPITSHKNLSKLFSYKKNVIQCCQLHSQ